MKNNSEKLLLEQICTITDCEHKTAPTQDIGIPLIRTPNIGKGNLLLGGVKRVSHEIYNIWSKRAKPQPGDLIMAREAPVGNVAIISKNLQVCLGQRTVLIRPNHKYIDSKYLNYLLNSTAINSFLIAISNGATVGHLNVGDIRKLPLPQLPSLHVQKKIAAILSAYDDLIENNNRRIAILEKMAEEIYREWFVRLRFPGHEQVKFNKGIPQEWEVVKLNEAIFIKNGKSIELDEYGKYTVYGSNGIIGKAKKYNAENSIVIGRVGAYCGSIQFEKNKFWATDNTIIATANTQKTNNFLCFFILNNLKLGNFAGGSAQPLLTQNLIGKIEILLAPQEINLEFAHFMTNIFRQIEILIATNYNLKNSRDRLLTRLISGKLSVEDLDIQFPPSMTEELK